MPRTSPKTKTPTPTPRLTATEKTDLREAYRDSNATNRMTKIEGAAVVGSIAVAGVGLATQDPYAFVTGAGASVLAGRDLLARVRRRSNSQSYLEGLKAESLTKGVSPEAVMAAATGQKAAVGKRVPASDSREQAIQDHVGRIKDQQKASGRFWKMAVPLYAVGAVSAIIVPPVGVVVIGAALVASGYYAAKEHLAKRAIKKANVPEAIAVEAQHRVELAKVEARANRHLFGVRANIGTPVSFAGDAEDEADEPKLQPGRPSKKSAKKGKKSTK